MAMDAETAARLLDALGCGTDPVTVLSRNLSVADYGEVSTPVDLGEAQRLESANIARDVPGDVPAHRIRLRYWSDKGERVGTLRQMVICRLNELADVRAK